MDSPEREQKGLCKVERREIKLRAVDIKLSF
jgi:hypothetical protein